MITDIEVDERAWRDMCARQGISLEGQVVGTHVANSVRNHALQYLESIGFPQQQKGK